MQINKDQLLGRIGDLRKAQDSSLTPMSRSLQLAERRLILDVIEFLLITDTARQIGKD